MLWSWILAAIGVFGLYLTTRKLAAGYAVGMLVQVLWIAYAITTKQYGFIFSAIAYGTVNSYGYYSWTKEKTETKLTEDISLADKWKLEVMEAIASLKSDDKPDISTEEVETEQESLDDLLVEDRLPPSGFDNRGDPTWNVYPYVQRMGESIVIGSSLDRRYPMSKADANLAGRALIEASIFEKNEE